MREKIYTIPVTDAIREASECPFCKMYASLENNAVEFVMGPSYMERDVREKTDKMGFCNKHLGTMSKSQNTLGLALMLQTRLMRVNKELGSASGGISPKKMKKATGDPLAALIKKQGESCYVCDMAERTFEMYISTFFHLWKSEDDFRKLVSEGKGFCLPHFGRILEEGDKKLSSKEFAVFRETVVKIQMENLTRLEEEIDWFVKKFDYRYSNEPWKNSQDSVPRTISKLTSYPPES